MAVIMMKIMNQKKMAKVYLAPNYADIAKSLKYELTNFFRSRLPSDFFCKFNFTLTIIHSHLKFNYVVNT